MENILSVLSSLFKELSLLTWDWPELNPPDSNNHKLYESAPEGQKFQFRLSFLQTLLFYSLFLRHLENCAVGDANPTLPADLFCPLLPPCMFSLIKHTLKVRFVCFFFFNFFFTVTPIFSTVHSVFRALKDRGMMLLCMVWRGNP